MFDDLFGFGGGSADCKTCYDKGEVNCQHCKQTGLSTWGVTCSECQGKLKIPCPDCQKSDDGGFFGF
jgi:hypothetical protein